MKNNKDKNSPLKFDMTSAGGMGILSGIGNIASGLIGRGDRRDAQIAAQNEYTTMLSKYRNLDTRNLYANVQSQYEGLENTFEDLTVNQQQAQFEAQQGQQQRANIMQNLRGAAGSSGIAGLAQAMAAQGQLATQRASASIGQQESRINMLKAQEASKIQQLERAGEAQAEQLRLAGASQARQLKYQQTSTLLGMAQQEKAERDKAVAEGNAALYGGIGQLVGGIAAMISDRRLKKNINLIGKSPSGLNIYSFEYINSNYGDGVYQGVMSDEIPLNAVVNNGSYDMVKYDMIDVEFKKIN